MQCAYSLPFPCALTIAPPPPPHMQIQPGGGGEGANMEGGLMSKGGRVTGICGEGGGLSLTNKLYRQLGTKAKYRHLKKFTCKGTLRQVFIRV